jgi:hypothetical protein
MHNVGFALAGAWKVLLAGLVLGAGLPILFGLGIRALAWGTGGDAKLHAEGVTGPKARPIGTALGWLCFLVVVLGVVLGIAYIVATGFGKTISFAHVYPTIVAKH